MELLLYDAHQGASAFAPLCSARMGVSFFSCGQLIGRNVPTHPIFISLKEAAPCGTCGKCNPRPDSGKSTLLVPLRVGVISPFHDVTMPSCINQDPTQVKTT